MPEAIFKIIFYYGGDWGWEEREKKKKLSVLQTGKEAINNGLRKAWDTLHWHGLRQVWTSARINRLYLEENRIFKTMFFMSKSIAVQVVISPNQSWPLWTGWKWGVELSKFHRTAGTPEKAKTRQERGAPSAVPTPVKMLCSQGWGRAGWDTDSRRPHRLGTAPTFKHYL